MSQLLAVNSLQALSHEGQALSPAMDFEIHEGDVLFLNGENGAGKSTLLKTILGLHPHFRGSFKFHIQPEQIQYLPQLGNLHFHLPLTLRDMLGNEENRSEIIRGLDLNKKWNTASGGERQKVLLASVFAKKPKLLILDEPFNHVDKESGHSLESALSQFLKENPQSSLLIVSHRALVQSWPQVRFVEVRWNPS